MATTTATGVPDYGSGGGGGEAGRPSMGLGEVKRRDTGRHSPEQPLSLLFRLLQLAASVISFVVMLVASQLDLSWRSYQAFRYVFSVVVIAAAWSLLMLLIELVQLIMGRKIRSLMWRAIVAIGDWLTASLLFSGACAAAALTTFNDRGVVLFNYAPCVGPSPYSLLCSRLKASVAFAFIAFGFFLPHLILSTLSLLMRMFLG